MTLARSVVAVFMIHSVCCQNCVYLKQLSQDPLAPCFNLIQQFLCVLLLHFHLRVGHAGKRVSFWWCLPCVCASMSVDAKLERMPITN